MTYRGYIARLIDDDEKMIDELREFAAHHRTPPDVREHVLWVLHNHEMAKRAVQTDRLRRVAQAALDEIEKEPEGPRPQCI